MKRNARKLARPETVTRTRKLDRRTFVKLLPAAGAAGVAAVRGEAPAAPSAPAPPQPSQRVTREALHSTQQLIGIELTEAQEALALPRVNSYLSSFETLRKIDVPLDTEPSSSFRPWLPGSRAAARARPRRRFRRGRLELGKVDVPPYKSLEDVAFFTAGQLGELIRTGKVSPVELTRMYIARLKRYGPRLNCTITLTEELAVKQAVAAEREIRRGKYRGPLHGIPWGAKDLLATRGIPTTWGAEPYRDQVIDYDATVIERLREAGAVLLAKLSMGSLAMGGRWFGGLTRNPWQVEEASIGSSGSSAGSASATSAGLVGFSIGTETLGSIISPSARCGVVGLRPTYGRVSRYGAMALCWTMDKIGPICRGVEDCAAVLHAIYGPDGRDLTVTDASFTWEPDRQLDKMRIGYLKAEFEQGPENRKAMYRAALDALKSSGAKLQPVELPTFSTGSLLVTLFAEAAAAFDDLTRSGGVNRLTAQGPGDWPNQFRSARFIPAVEYLRAQRARTLLMREMDALMAKWDVLISPAPQSASLSLTNLTGHPAMAVPCGFINGLPQSIMFTAGLYDEAAALRVALAFERATIWHKMIADLRFQIADLTE